LTVFIPGCPENPDYAQQIIKKNKSILGRLDRDSIITYNAANPEEINSLLTSYCLNQRITSEVMIVPQGPKTISLISLLISVRYPDIKLWEIISNENNNLVDSGQSFTDPVVVKVTFIHDEMEMD
jgi:hypothetical protein